MDNSIERQSSGRLSRLIAFASGKGGVGKTVCTANVAMHLAKTRTVVAVDLDLGSGNLNTTLGVKTINRSVNDFFRHRSATLDEFKVDTEIPNLKLISSAYTSVGTTALTAPQKKRLLESLRADPADYVLMDLGAGTRDEVLELFAAADLKILVTSPESLALHNAFVFAKAFAYHAIVRGLDAAGIRKRKRDRITARLYEASTEEISHSIEEIRREDASLASIIQNALEGVTLGVIFNKVQSPSEERYRENLQRIVLKYGELQLISLGSVPYDENIKNSVNDIVPFSLNYSDSPASAAFAEVAEHIDRVASHIQPSPIVVSSGGSFERLAAMLEDTWTSVTSQLWSDPPQNTGEPARTAPPPANAEQAEQGETMHRERSDETEKTSVREKPVTETTDHKREAMARLQQAAEEMMGELELALAETDTRIAQLQSNVRDRDERIARLEAQVADQERAISQLREEQRLRAQAAGEQKQSLEAVLKDRNIEIKSLSRQASEQSTSIQNLQTQIKVNEEAAAEEKHALQSKVNQLESTVQSLESDLLSKDTHVMVLETELRESKRNEERTRAELEGKLKAVIDQRQQLEVLVAERETQVADTLRQLSEKSQMIRKLQDEHQLRLRAANEQKERLVRSLSEKDSAVEQLTDDLKIRDEKIALLEGELNQTASIIQNVQQLLQKRDAGAVPNDQVFEDKRSS